MTFSVVKGRPLGTQETDRGVVHYTCNPPNPEILGQLGISMLGARFGIDPREVLLIPDELFKSSGLAKDTIGAETLLSRLSRR